MKEKCCCFHLKVQVIKKSKERRTLTTPGPSECVGERHLHVHEAALEHLSEWDPSLWSFFSAVGLLQPLRFPSEIPLFSPV